MVFLGFIKLQSQYQELDFAHGHPSFSLLLAAEISADEERRINDKLEEARGKFRAKRIESSAGAVNAVALRLPPSINLKAAVDAINLSWGNHDTDLVGVFLTRIQLVSSSDFSFSYPGFQWQWVPNPFAKHPLPADSFRCDIPIGQPLATTEIAYLLTIDDQIQQIKRGFMRTTGQMYYSLRDPRELMGRTFNLRRAPGVEFYLVFPDRERVSMNMPPTDAFVFL